jgi:hypothetical protein
MQALATGRDGHAVAGHGTSLWWKRVHHRKLDVTHCSMLLVEFKSLTACW